MDGVIQNLEPPKDNEFEVTLITGCNGYGESIILHLGGGKWAIVDCCVNSNNGECIPIEYLKLLHVDISSQLTYVLCTHWHKDHCNGISKILEQCSSNTIFLVSCANDRQKFIYEMLDDSEYTGRSSIFKELKNAFKVAKERNIQVKRVKQDQLLFRNDKVTCFGLSPTEDEVREFDTEIASAMNKMTTAIQQYFKVDKQEIQNAEDIENEILDGIQANVDVDVTVLPKEEVAKIINYEDAKTVEQNHRSVALLISFGIHNVVLGADLETVPVNPNRGWQGVMESICIKDTQSDLFKIPHHGSKTGYYEDFLQKHVKNDAVMKLSTWISGGNRLPKREMLEAYYNHSENLYITSISHFLKKTNTVDDKSIRKLMSETTDSIYELNNDIGIVQSRVDINGLDTWSTKIYGTAKQIDSNLLSWIKGIN